jgi:hypothetical protein
MPRALRALLITTLLLSASLDASAQQGDMEYFASLDGLQRVIARSWSAPFPGMESADATPAATPAASPAASPVASPEADAGIMNISIFVYLFDSDEAAAAGYERIDADLAKTREVDRNAPMEDSLPLDGIGDQANGFMGQFPQGDATYTFTFGTVLDGPFVYSISGMFTGDNGPDLTRDYLDAMVGAPMDRMAEQFDRHGGSRGGLWSKLSGVQPPMPEGSGVADFLVYQMPEGNG